MYTDHLTDRLKDAATVAKGLSCSVESIHVGPYSTQYGTADLNLPQLAILRATAPGTDLALYEYAYHTDTPRRISYTLQVSDRHTVSGYLRTAANDAAITELLAPSSFTSREPKPEAEDA